MTKKKRNWLIAIGLAGIFVLAALLITGYTLVNRFEPYVRSQAILYLEKRFDSKVELAALHLRLPTIPPVKLWLNRGRGVIARVEGDGISMRHKGRVDVPPMFLMKKFSFEVDLGMLFDPAHTINSVTIEGMEINIPPKGERPNFGSDGPESNAQTESDESVVINEVIIKDSALTILPRDPKKTPLHFDLHAIRLESAGNRVAMTYDASLTNAKPPGEIHSQGKFGPWNADEPGDTPLAGMYDFANADLGVFKGIAGILDSTGEFVGSLSSIDVKGEASVPDFRLKKPGNPVPLKTTFEVLVDGTNGNTILKPVIGTLGTTKFKTSGGVIKHEDEDRRTISLDVDMPDGNLRDVLRLAMKGDPFMEGRIALQTKIVLPPLSGKVREKLMLDGQFELSKARFLSSKIQDQIDTLSRRGQGQPKNEQIVEVASGMAGTFKMENEVINFESLSFAVPGAGVDLKGSYDLDQDALDFHGHLRLQAKVSQTMTGWKRWLLKPVDPFFAKQGAGTLVGIQIVGTSKEPKFGRDKGPKDDEKDEEKDTKVSDKNKKDVVAQNKK